MFITIIRITVQSEKLREFEQTVMNLRDDFRKETNCLGYNVYREVEDSRSYSLIGEWQKREAIDGHINSKAFSVLEGAIHTLGDSPKMKLHITSVVKLDH
jgi:quinol monooxygenase YgiN